jgi:hypothetical protein
VVSILTLNKGTIELLPVDITDKLGTITDLASYDVDYRVTDESEITDIIAWTPVNSKDLMRVFPLIDTTVGVWPEGTYKLYVRPTIPPEAPILGPMEFGLS